jgi:hypothetical protein
MLAWTTIRAPARAGSRKESRCRLGVGGRISVDSQGDWNFPVGTILVKTFSLGERKIETRLLVRHPFGLDWLHLRVA